MIGQPPQPPAVEIPRASDPRLVVELFAAAPDIVHPIGLAFDAKGRLLIIESHTHFRPKDYAGPKHDRIRVLEDTKGDGKADRFTTYFEGTTATMDIASHPDSSIYLATRNEIIRLRDTNGNGKADQRERLLFLDTKGDYPHNGLCGLCFDANGDLYFGMGENMGIDWALKGADGVTILGGGEGGNVFWCTKDGRKLRRVATGYWNPFTMCRDAQGRLFVADNDPDSMPPCRLVHLVEGGDYGYQYRYGRSGRHVFQAWDGELPGTLPMMSGTGEAPSKVLSCESAGLPRELLGNLLVTAWADHRVERYVVTERGASYTAERQPFVQGGKDFRPVGMAVAPDGSLFVSDWVMPDYTLHGRGAVWHIRSREPMKRADAAELRRDLLKALPPVHDPPNGDPWKQLLDADPFVRHAGVQRLAGDPAALASINLKQLGDPRQRIGFLLAHRATGRPDGRRLVSAFLSDPDEEVRFLAAKWISDERLVEQRARLAEAIQDPKLTPRMYMAFTTALARVEGREADEGKLADFCLDRAADAAAPAGARVLALRQVPVSHKRLTIDLLSKLLDQEDDALQLEAARALADHPDPKRFEALLEVMRSVKLSGEVRAQAVAGLAARAGEWKAELMQLALGAQVKLRDEALRCLVGTQLEADQKRELEELARRRPEAADLVWRVLGQPFAKNRSSVSDLDTWLRRLEGPADASAGRRIFAHAKLTTCSRCHRIDGRGSEIGPELSAIGRTERRAILESILQPSANIAPHYQAWILETTDGKLRTGLLTRTYLDEYTYLDEKGASFTLNSREIVASRPSPKSIMPDGLVDTLTDQELRDLLAYLCERR